MADWDDELDMVSREDVILKSLVKFYSKNPENLRILSSVSKQKTEISLREIDYTITNYNYNNKIIYRLKSGDTFNMALDYKNQLHGFSKKCFDPFCRRQRLFVPFVGAKNVTSESGGITSESGGITSESGGAADSADSADSADEEPGELIVPIPLSPDEIDQYKQRQDGGVTTIGQMNFFRWAITNEVLDFCKNNKALISEKMELSGKKKKALKTENSPHDIKVVVHFD